MPKCQDIKLKTFFLIFRLYTYIAFWGAQIFNKAISWAICNLPDKMIWSFMSSKSDSRKSVKLMIARGFSHKTKKSHDSTNAMRLFINMYWDTEACDETGGIQLYKLKQILGKTLDLLWMCYLYNQPELEISGEPDKVVPHIKYMFVDLKTSTVYKYNAYNIPEILGVEPIEVMFDQVSLSPEFSWD